MLLAKLNKQDKQDLFDKVLVHIVPHTLSEEADLMYCDLICGQVNSRSFNTALVFFCDLHSIPVAR